MRWRICRIMMDMINNLLLEVFAACAEFEMEKREKRQREGYEALKARGEWDKLGRSVKMTQEEFLNKWDQKGKNVTDKEFAESLNISKGTLQSYKKKYLKGKISDRKKPLEKEMFQGSLIHNTTSKVKETSNE